MGSILVVFASLLYLWETRSRLYFFDHGLYNTSQVIGSGVEEITLGSQRYIDLEDAPLLGSDTIKLDTDIVFARWYTPEKKLLQFMGSVPASILDEDLGLQTIQNPEFASSTPFRQLTLPVYRDNRLLGYLQIAAPLTPVIESLQQLRLFIAVGLPIALLLIACTGWYLGGRAMQPIRSAYQRLQQFTADASHELRAPLAAIISNAQLGLMEPTSSAEQTDCLKTISATGESMSQLVARLLFLARHQGNLQAETFQRVDVIALLTSIKTDYATQLAEQGLNFELNFEPSFEGHFSSAAAVIQGESGLLYQAIANLLDNAMRYSPTGGTISLKCQVQTRWVVIQIEDAGVGIPQADLPHIFERFYRVDKVRSRGHTGDKLQSEASGFGLGLALVRQIVELHKGKIEADSQLAQGTRFTIRLPLATNA